MDAINNVINATLIAAIGDEVWEPFPYQIPAKLEPQPNFSWLYVGIGNEFRHSDMDWLICKCRLARKVRRGCGLSSEPMSEKDARIYLSTPSSLF